MNVEMCYRTSLTVSRKSDLKELHKRFRIAKDRCICDLLV